jgi:hypothetical protein
MIRSESLCRSNSDRMFLVLGTCRINRATNHCYGTIVLEDVPKVRNIP